MEIALMKTITIDYQPAEHGMKSGNGSFNTPAQPGEPGISPSCAYVKHEDMLLSRARDKARKGLAAKTYSVAQRQRHCCAFIGKAALPELDLVQTLYQGILMTVFESGVISLKKDPSDIFQAILDLRIGANEATARELHLARINLQQSLGQAEHGDKLRPKEISQTAWRSCSKTPLRGLRHEISTSTAKLRAMESTEIMTRVLF